MPANKNAMTRYALIDRMLSNRNRAYSIQDITDELAVSLPEYGQSPVTKRCVEKDINYLIYDSPFSVEIEEYHVDSADRNDRPYRKRCLRYADPTFSIFKPKLTEDEKAVLATAIDTLGSFSGIENFEWIDSLRERLKLEELPTIISVSKNITANSTLIARLFTSIRSRQVITITYHTFADTSRREVTVTPHLLKESNNRWFLIATVCDTCNLLTFALDRIDDFRHDYAQRYIPAPEDILERYEDIIGITYIKENPLEKITFWASDHARDYISTKPMHGSQIHLRGERELALRSEYPQLAGGAFFQIECKHNYELIRELCAYGGELRVLSPTDIVSAVTKRISDMTRIYSL